MYPVSDRFLQRLTESHSPVTQVLLFLTDGRVVELEHTGGSVTVDRAQAIRRTCTVTIADPALIPRTPSDQLATYGAKLRISRGVEYGSPTYSSYGYKARSLFDFAETAGYWISDLFGNVIVELAAWEAVCDRSYWDFFLIPREKREQWECAFVT